MCVVAVRLCGLCVVRVCVWFVLCVWWCGVCLVVSCAWLVCVF